MKSDGHDGQKMSGFRPCFFHVYPLEIQHSYGKWTIKIGDLLIQIAIFHSYVSHDQRVILIPPHCPRSAMLAATLVAPESAALVPVALQPVPGFTTAVSRSSQQ